MEKTVGPTLRHFIDEWMQIIDVRLGHEHVPVPERPLKAAFLFVGLAVKEIKGDTKENFFNKTWFTQVYQETEAWYQEKYRDALQRQRKALAGVCIHSGVPFELYIPSTVSRVEKEGETCWLIFPVEVQEGESPMTWIVRPPNLSTMQVREKRLLQKQVVEIGTSLRSIHLDLMTAERPDPTSDRQASDILTHLQTSATHISDPARAKLGLACWEAHQAAETSLKLISRQKTGDHKKCHELKTLHQQASQLCNPPVSEELIQRLPSKKRVLEMRAGEGPTVTLPEGFRIYRSAIRYVKECAAAMPRKLGIRNAAFLIRKPPFVQ